MQDIVDIGDQLSALLEQTVGALTVAAVQVSRDGEQFPPLFQGKLPGYQGATARTGFDNQNPFAESADDPVATGKMPGQRGRSGGIFTDDGILRQNVFKQLFVFLRIDAVNTTAEDGDRRAVDFEGTAMGCAVDTARQTADNADVVAGQGARQLAETLSPLGVARRE